MCWPPKRHTSISLTGRERPRGEDGTSCMPPQPAGQGLRGRVRGHEVEGDDDRVRANAINGSPLGQAAQIPVRQAIHRADTRAAAPGSCQQSWSVRLASPSAAVEPAGPRDAARARTAGLSATAGPAEHGRLFGLPGQLSRRADREQPAHRRRPAPAQCPAGKGAPRVVRPLPLRRTRRRPQLLSSSVIEPE